MRIMAYLKKTFKENIREWKISILALVFGPFFVYMMYAYFGNATINYTLLTINRDQAVSSSTGRLSAGAGLLAQWEKAKYPDGKAMFKVKKIMDPEAGKRELKNRDADLLLVIPVDFSCACGGTWKKRTRASRDSPVSGIMEAPASAWPLPSPISSPMPIFPRWRR